MVIIIMERTYHFLLEHPCWIPADGHYLCWRACPAEPPGEPLCSHHLLTYTHHKSLPSHLRSCFHPKVHFVKWWSNISDSFQLHWSSSNTDRTLKASYRVVFLKKVALLYCSVSCPVTTAYGTHIEWQVSICAPLFLLTILLSIWISSKEM